MTYNEANIIHKFLYNQVDKNKFYELMLKTDSFFTKPYMDEKWKNYQDNMHSFTFTWESFFNEVVKDINNTNYKG